MDEIIKELNEAYQIISSIPVTGDSVDALAVARAKMRKVYAELKNMSEEVTDHGHGA